MSAGLFCRWTISLDVDDDDDETKSILLEGVILTLLYEIEVP